MSEVASPRTPIEAARGRELYVLLSDRCNFSCSHCLNSSGPQAKRWNPTDESLRSLADEINSTPEIRALHFSGGEPTLFLPQIKKLLQSVRRALPITLTTNGWFADRSLQFIDELPLASVVISHDRFHAPFISLVKLIPLIEHFLSRKVDVSLNFVFSEIQDLADLAPVQALKIPIHTSRIIKSGRANWELDWRDANAAKQSCPSLAPEQRRSADLDKTVYISERGFTPCCGPLAFDETAPSDFIYSESLSSYSSNPLLKAISAGSFEEQARSIGLDISSHPFQSSCDACALLYGSVGTGLPSVSELAQANIERSYFHYSASLQPEQEQLLLQKYLVAYTETLNANELNRQLKTMAAPKEIQAASIEPSDYSAVIEFVRKNYYLEHAKHYSKNAIEEFVAVAPEYLSWPSSRGWIYRKNGQIIGTLWANHFDPHSALNEPTIHIGYWGYDRSSLTLDEARWIKNDWLRHLADLSRGILPIDASFDCFNTSAIRFAHSLGFKRKLLRLDRKVT